MCKTRTALEAIKQNKKSVPLSKAQQIHLFERLCEDIDSLFSGNNENKKLLLEIKAALEKKSSWWVNFRELANSKVGVVIVIFLLGLVGKAVGIEVYNAVAKPADVTSIIMESGK